jgi:hypothetical protein
VEHLQVEPRREITLGARGPDRLLGAVAGAAGEVDQVGEQFLLVGLKGSFCAFRLAGGMW